MVGSAGVLLVSASAERGDCFGSPATTPIECVSGLPVGGSDARRAFAGDDATSVASLERDDGNEIIRSSRCTEPSRREYWSTLGSVTVSAARGSTPTNARNVTAPPGPTSADVSSSSWRRRRSTPSTGSIVKRNCSKSPSRCIDASSRFSMRMISIALMNGSLSAALPPELSTPSAGS